LASRDIQPRELTKLNTYMVPIVARYIPDSEQLLEEGEVPNLHLEYGVNWRLIEDLMDYVRTDLLSFCLTDNTGRSQVMEKYGLIDRQAE
jgi:hypothetical protein